MAGLFLMFIMAIALGEMISGTHKNQDDVEGQNGPTVIIFNPDDDAHEWDELLKR